MCYLVTLISTSNYLAINKAIACPKKKSLLALFFTFLLIDSTKLQQSYGKEYKYSHDYDKNFVSQEFLPEEISGSKLYEPSNNLKENKLREYLKLRWKDKYKY